MPVISTIHSDYKLDYMGRTLGGLVYGNINAIALRHMDYRIGVSDAMVDLLISRGFPAETFYAIYNGLDFDVPEITENRLDYLRSLGAKVEEDSIVVGIAARLDPVKDIPTLLRGFAAAAKTSDKLRLVIAGDGAEKEKLQALAKELGIGLVATNDVHYIEKDDWEAHDVLLCIQTKLVLWTRLSCYFSVRVLLRFTVTRSDITRTQYLRNVLR